MKVLILEDDPLAVLDYELVIDELGFEVCGIFNTLPKALKRFKKLQPDCAIVDLYVGDKLGFELVVQFNKYNIPVILCTGHPSDQVLDTALEMQVYSFVTKPFTHQELKFTLTKLKNQLVAQKDESFVFFKTKYNLVKILYTDIIYIEADGNYSIIQTVNNKHIIKKSLVKIIELLPSDKFVRVYRSIVVNMSKIVKVDFVNNSVVLGLHSFPISEKYKPTLKDSLSTNFPFLKI